jgi:hypothetical protein
MPNASISRAHVLLQLRKEKSEELLNLLTHILSLQRVSFIIRRNQSNLSVLDRDLSFPRLQLTRRECSRPSSHGSGSFIPETVAGKAECQPFET